MEHELAKPDPFHIVEVQCIFVEKMKFRNVLLLGVDGRLYRVVSKTYSVHGSLSCALLPTSPCPVFFYFVFKENTNHRIIINEDFGKDVLFFAEDSHSILYLWFY